MYEFELQTDGDPARLTKNGNVNLRLTRMKAANGVVMVKFLKYWFLPMIAVAIFTLLLPAQGNAANMCGKRGELVKVLKNKYKEVPVAMGISQKSTEAFEIYVSTNGSWTVMMTTTSGVTCVMAAGHSWKDIPKTLADPVT